LSSSTKARFTEYLFSGFQTLLPHHFLSSIMFRLTRSEWTPFKNLIIRQVVKTYCVDMSLAADPIATNFASFNHFFTRELKQGVRPIDSDKNTIVSPVDGAISQLGTIQDGRVFQAKGQDYTLLELLGGDQEWCEKLENGLFNTIYLSPRDYHRIHCPVDATLKRMTLVPGRLFSVNPGTARTVPRLFSRNERLVNLFDTEYGPMAVIFVGAIFVSSMDTVWSGNITPSQRGRINTQNYPDNDISFRKGDEIGRFNMGSTVILLFPKNSIDWLNSYTAGSTVQLGQALATRKKDTSS